MRKFIRHKTKGTIYNFNELMLLGSPNTLEEVTEKEAFPERFQPKKTKGRKPRITLEEVKIEEEPDPTPPELAQEASKGWPK